MELRNITAVNLNEEQQTKSTLNSSVNSETNSELFLDRKLNKNDLII